MIIIPIIILNISIHFDFDIYFLIRYLSIKNVETMDIIIIIRYIINIRNSPNPIPSKLTNILNYILKSI